MLEKEPQNRLGANNGVEELFAHPFLASINVEALVNKELVAPFKPKLNNDVFNVTNFDS